MNDIEHELRELMHDRSSEASTTPLAPPNVLKRGRRRQIGTVTIGGATAILVIVASVAGFRLALPEHTVTAAAQNDLPERTAAIQDFTVTAPDGWTLIDWWPPVSAAISAAPASPAPTTTPPATAIWFPYPTPVFELANVDPGLSQAPCRADAAIGSTDAVMVIERGNLVWNDGSTEAPQPWPVPVDPDATRIGPCGEGHYASFMLDGSPYFAFLRVGADTSDGDRQALFDAYSGLQVRAQASTVVPFATGTGAGYVMAAGTEQGTPWLLELGRQRPTLASVTQAAPCLRVIVGDVGGGLCTPLAQTAAAIAIGHPLVDQVLVAGAVAPDASSVELRVPGQAPVAATLADIPDSLEPSTTDPLRIYWVIGDARVEGSQIVQLAADGTELSHSPVVFISLTTTAAVPIASGSSLPSSPTPSPSP